MHAARSGLSLARMSASLVLIVGGGPTGMALAIELRRAGLNVRIIDKASHPAQHSQALVVQSRTLEQFQRYGIARQAIAQGRKLTGAHIYGDGKQIISVSTERIPSRYPYLLFIPQSETEALLNRYMESLGVPMERETELISFTQQGSGAESGILATLRSKGVEETVSARWIAGCDGAHSTVRSLLQIPFEGESIGLSFFLGDLEIEGPDAPSNDAAVHLHEGNVVFMGRLSETLVRLIVALHSEPGKPSGQASSNQPSSPAPSQDLQEELTLQQFQAAVDRAGIRVKIKSSQWMTPFNVNDRQAQHYRVGNAFLAGDASHIHSPVGGQGMNTGIQDAANLGWKLAAVANGADPALLDSYEEERLAVGKDLLRFTGAALKLATTANPVLESIRNALAPIVTRLTPVQSAATGFISESSINYRSSSIVVDHGGDGSLRAGDRLPDLSLKSLDSLTSLNSPDGATLLDRWQEARPLALLLEPTPDEEVAFSQVLARTKRVVVRTRQLDDSGRHALGIRPKLLLLRPDGYIGFRVPFTAAGALPSWI